MKMKNWIWFYLIILLGFVLFITSRCKKDDNNSTNQNGEIIFNPNLTYETVADIDGNVYKTITIGTQTWMAENLKTTKYRNGDLIGTTIPYNKDISGETDPKYQWAYEGNESYVAIYGRLYTWYASNDSRNLCPTGWHLASNDEWNILTLTLDPKASGNDYGNISYIAAGKLKEIGTTHWLNPNLHATNESGYTALPSGNRNQFGVFRYIGEYGYLWSSSEYNTECAYALDLSYNCGDLIRVYLVKKNVSSVRCIKD
jgi:uncharacterized protein (TIGR02145 family)